MQIPSAEQSTAAAVPTSGSASISDEGAAVAAGVATHAVSLARDIRLRSNARRMISAWLRFSSFCRSMPCRTSCFDFPMARRTRKPSGGRPPLRLCTRKSDAIDNQGRHDKKEDETVVGEKNSRTRSSTRRNRKPISRRPGLQGILSPWPRARHRVLAQHLCAWPATRHLANAGRPSSEDCTHGGLSS